MKKLKVLSAIIMSFVIALTSIILCDTKVKAATYPTSISGIKKGTTLKYNGYDSLFYKSNGSYDIFCTTFHIANVGSSCKIENVWTDPVRAGVAAIIKKYNANKSQKNYYNAELAINEFLYYYGASGSIHKTKSRISTTRDVRNTSGVSTYYKAAVDAYNKVNKDFKFSITNSSLKFNESGKYYVSDKVTVKDANGNLSSYTADVSGAKGAEIYKKSGNSFYVRVPKSSVTVGSSVTVKLTVKGTKSYDVARRFDCGSGNQKVTPNTTDTASKNASASISGKITVKGNTVKVYKKIDGTDTNLAGAKLVIKNAKGEVIKSWTSTEKVKTFENLEAGTYTLSEEEAPSGYNKASKDIKFTVALDNKTTTLKIYNKAKELTKVKAIKLDAETKEALKGAVLVVKDANGKVVDKWTTDTKEHEIKNLTKGTFTLSEESAPVGYKLTNDVKTFEVTNDEKTITLEVLNNKMITHVEILKIDAKTNLGLAGATLVVKNDKGEIKDSWVSTTEAHEITGLPAGKYTLTETIAPVGYELAKESVTFEIKNSEETIKVEMKNDPITIVTKVRISKQDVTTGKELPGAHLQIKNEAGELVKEWVSTNEPQEFELDPGKYTLSETIAPEGYKLKTETIDFEVKEDGTVTEVVMYNSPEEEPETPDVPDVPKYPVRISKQDITTKQELPGATLVVKDSEGKEILRWVSGSTPKEFELPAGDYTLTEIQAPNGYDLSYEVINFTVEADNSITTDVVMYNSKTPNTADKNIILIVFGFMSAIAGSIFGFKKFKKQL